MSIFWAILWVIIQFIWLVPIIVFFVMLSRNKKKSTSYRANSNVYSGKELIETSENKFSQESKRNTSYPVNSNVYSGNEIIETSEEKTKKMPEESKKFDLSWDEWFHKHTVIEDTFNSVLSSYVDDEDRIVYISCTLEELLNYKKIKNIASTIASSINKYGYGNENRFLRLIKQLHCTEFDFSGKEKHFKILYDMFVNGVTDFSPIIINDISLDIFTNESLYDLTIIDKDVIMKIMRKCFYTDDDELIEHLTNLKIEDLTDLIIDDFSETIKMIISLSNEEYMREKFVDSSIVNPLQFFNNKKIIYPECIRWLIRYWLDLDRKKHPVEAMSREVLNTQANNNDENDVLFQFDGFTWEMWEYAYTQTAICDIFNSNLSQHTDYNERLGYILLALEDLRCFERIECIGNFAAYSIHLYGFDNGFLRLIKALCELRNREGNGFCFDGKEEHFRELLLRYISQKINFSSLRTYDDDEFYLNTLHEGKGVSSLQELYINKLLEPSLYDLDIDSFTKYLDDVIIPNI